VKLLILSLPGAAGWGGSEELWAEVARVALAAGHQVWITPRVDHGGPGTTRVHALVSAGAVVVPRETGDGVRRDPPPAVPATARAIARGADVILLSAGGSVRELLHPDVRELVAASRPTPLFLTVQLVGERDLLSDAERLRASWLLREAAGVILPAERSHRVLERVLAAPVPRVSVVPSPIRSDLTGVVPWPRASTARFACVGRLNPAQKGQDALLEALADRRWRDRDWRLSFIGTGIGRDYLQNLALHYGLTDRVVFSDFQESMAEVWSQHELLIVPSREEGMPIVIMEAAYCGRPCLVTDVGDNATFVDHGESGFVAHSDRLRSLSAALEDAWHQRAEWPEMGRRAHLRFCQWRDPQPGRTVLALMSGRR